MPQGCKLEGFLDASKGWVKKHAYIYTFWVFPKNKGKTPQNGFCENNGKPLFKIDDLGVSLFSETSTYIPKRINGTGIDSDLLPAPALTFSSMIFPFTSPGRRGDR